MEKYLIVIPARNEEDNIYEVVTRSLKYADTSVTNDGSDDHTGAILRQIELECKQLKHAHYLNVISHENSTHIPKSIQDGMRYGVVKGYDFIITMDAGLSHDPSILPDFINSDRAIDVIIGSRHLSKDIPLYRKFVSRMAARIVNYSLSSSFIDFSGPRLRDCTSGFRRYSRRATEIIVGANLKSKSFDFHMEALALCVRNGMDVAEIPIAYRFSNSSFNGNVLCQGIKFGIYLIASKKDSHAGESFSI